MVVQSISSVFADRARTAPDQVLVTDTTGATTAGEIDERANRLARLLHKHHVQRDDLVEVALPNGVDFVVACLAIWRAGATPMPFEPAMRADERATLRELAQPTVVIGASASASVPVVTESDALEVSAGRLPDIWSSSWKAPASSGSTGVPKIVVSQTPALVDPEAPVAAFVPRQAKQLVCSPLWHSTAFTYAFRGLTAGHTLVIEPHFDEHRFLRLVAEHRITWTVLSPPSIRRLLRLPESERHRHDLSSLESVLHLGARCPAPDKQALIAWLGAERVVEVYAGSESNGLTMATGSQWLHHPGTAGKPIGGTELEIRLRDGSVAAAGVAGTIWMRRGSAPSYRYLGAPGRRRADGWDTLGDVGYVDDDGYLYVLDRESDIIRRGSDHLYPADVEQCLAELPGVDSAVAFAEAGPDGRSQLSVTIETAAHTCPAELVAQYIERHFGAQWRPARIMFTDTPLRNDAGKIRRRAPAGNSLRGPARPTDERTPR
ncbi:AMP-binding protein [Gordonia sp. DT219]|uniref:AMP-binding protein n=1 Tax=Gordonia sp. DT219 TaxID=3416658 RepID=UPI003CEC69B3